MRFPEFAGEWESKELSKIGKTYNGLSGKSGSDFGQGSTYITYKSIFADSKVDLSRVEYVSIAEGETQNRVAYGDIFFTTSSETPEEVGMSSVLLDAVEDCYLNSFCFGYRLYDLKEHIPEFFRFYLRSDIARKNISVLAQGSTRFNISKNEVMKLKANLPLPEEQIKIATFLSFLDDRIATQSQIIKELESLMKGLSHFVFDKIQTEVKPICFSELYVTAKEGGTPDTKKANYYEGGQIPFIKIDDLKNKYLGENQWFITDEGLNNSSAWVVPAYSIIYSNGATIGSISINKYPVATKQGILGVVVKDTISVEYLFYYMSSEYFRQEVAKITTHGTMKTAYLKDIDGIKCYLPEYEQQEKLANIFKVLTTKIMTEQNILTEYQKQKKYLLNQMFI